MCGSFSRVAPQSKRTSFGVMSSSMSKALLRLKPWATTAFTVGMYMGIGDLLVQKIALKREHMQGVDLSGE